MGNLYNTGKDILLPNLMELRTYFGIIILLLSPIWVNQILSDLDGNRSYIAGLFLFCNYSSGI